jgi:hypothetical protein
MLGSPLQIPICSVVSGLSNLMDLYSSCSGTMTEEDILALVRLSTLAELALHPDHGSEWNAFAQLAHSPSLTQFVFHDRSTYSGQFVTALTQLRALCIDFETLDSNTEQSIKQILKYLTSLERFEMGWDGYMDFTRDRRHDFPPFPLSCLGLPHLTRYSAFLPPIHHSHLFSLQYLDLGPVLVDTMQPLASLPMLRSLLLRTPLSPIFIPMLTTLTTLKLLTFDPDEGIVTRTPAVRYHFEMQDSTCEQGPSHNTLA